MENERTVGLLLHSHWHIHTYVTVDTLIRTCTHVYDIEDDIRAYRNCCVQARSCTIPCSLLGFKVCPFRSMSLRSAYEATFRGQMRRNFCFPLVDFNIAQSASRINAVQVYRCTAAQMTAQGLYVRRAC